MQIASEGLKGRVFEVSLADLQNVSTATLPMTIHFQCTLLALRSCCYLALQGCFSVVLTVQVTGASSMLSYIAASC